MKAPFLPRPVVEGPQADPLFDPYSPDALWPVDLVAADGDDVHIPQAGADDELSKALDAIAVDEEMGVLPPGGLGNGKDVVYRPGFAVHQHHRKEDGPFVHRFLHRLGGDDPLRRGGKEHRLEAGFCKVLYRGQHRFMLDGGGDHLAAPPAGGHRPAQNSQVVSLAAAGGEEQFLPPCPQHLRQLPAGRGKGLLRQKAPAVEGGGVPVFFAHQLQSSVGRARADPGGGAVIQVDFQRGTSSCRFFCGKNIQTDIV